MSAQLATAIIAGLGLLATVVNLLITLHTKNEVLKMEIRIKDWAGEEFQRKPEPRLYHRRQNLPDAG